MQPESRPGSMGTSLNDAATKMLENDSSAARSYLFYRWFSELMEAIREEREVQGFSQQDLAAKLHTTQSSIARLENDRRGSVSVRRLWDYAFGVGLSPLVELRPASGLMSFVRNQPDAWLRASDFDNWVTQQAAITSEVGSGLAAIATSSYNLSFTMSNTVQTFVTAYRGAAETLRNAMKLGITGFNDAQKATLGFHLDQGLEGGRFTPQNTMQVGASVDSQSMTAMVGDPKADDTQKWAA